MSKKLIKQFLEYEFETMDKQISKENTKDTTYRQGRVSGTLFVFEYLNLITETETEELKKEISHLV